MPSSVEYTITFPREGNVSVWLPAGAISDADGNPVMAFRADYAADIAEIAPAPFPTLTSMDPAGSLIYQGTRTGRFNSLVPPFVAAGSGGLNRAIGMDFDDDNNLYVSSFNSDQVMRYDATTGAPKGISGQADDAVFVTTQLGGLDNPEYLRVGPDGLIYVVSSTTNQVFRYNMDGSLHDIFVTSAVASSVGLVHPLGLAFDGDNNLYVGGANSDNIIRVTASGNATVFVTTGSGGLTWPESMVFGPDRNLYVSSASSGKVLLYDGVTGTFIKPFVSTSPFSPYGLNFPTGLAFGPDGDLYVSCAGSNQVERADGSTGEIKSVFVPEGAAGLSRPTDLVWRDGALYVSTADQSTILKIDGSSVPGDADTHTLALDANQTLALRVDTPVAATLTLTHSILGTITLPTDRDPGPGLVYQPIQFKDLSGAPVAGTVTIRVQAPEGLTTNAYSIQATLNAQLDQDNDGSVLPQSLAPSTIDVEPGPVEINRAAVAGSLERAVSRISTETEGPVNTSGNLRGSWDPVGAVWTINNSNGVTGSLNTTAPTSSKSYDYFDGWDFYGRAGDVINVWTFGTSSGGGTLAKARVRIFQSNGAPGREGDQVGTGSDYAIQNFTLPGTGIWRIGVYTESGYKGTYTLRADLTAPVNPRPNAADVYSVDVTIETLKSFTYLSLGAATGSAVVGQPKVALSLYAPGDDPLTGTPVATSSARGTLDGLIEYKATQAGEYTVKVTAGAGLTSSSTGYSLVGVANGALEANGSNGSFSTAQDISDRPGVLGALTAADAADFYQETLTAGQIYVFSTSTPGDGEGQPVNLLNPHIELGTYNSKKRTFTPVTASTILADGRNEQITYSVPAGSGGAYYVRVTGENGTLGDYVLDPFAVSIGSAQRASPSISWSDPIHAVALAAWTMYDQSLSRSGTVDQYFFDLGQTDKENRRAADHDYFAQRQNTDLFLTPDSQQTVAHATFFSELERLPLTGGDGRHGFVASRINDAKPDRKDKTTDLLFDQDHAADLTFMLE